MPRRWIITTAALVALVPATAGILGGWRASRQLNETFEVQVEHLPADLDVDLDRGQALAAATCGVCHGEDLGGRALFDDPMLGHIDAPNLTRGRGGIGATLDDDALLRAVRQGVAADGRSLVVMPSQDFGGMSAADLASLFAAVRAAPPIDRATDPPRFTPFGRALIGLGAFGDLRAAPKTRHRDPMVAATPDDPARRGAYFVRAASCRSCHGEDLRGGRDPNPDAPPGPDLTRTGRLASWGEADFLRALREGVRPDGSSIDPEFMPWQGFGAAPDADLRAVWAYLQSQ